MRDGPLRRAIKAVARRTWSIDLAVSRWLARRRGERPHLLAGDCRLCARCCEEPAIRVGRLLWHARLLRRPWLWWQRVVNGFELVGADARSRCFRFRCTHFDAATRRCDSYDSRPGMCRDYPRALLWQARPELFPECGFRARPPNAPGLLRALAEQPLTEDQRERLIRDLALR